MRFELSHAPRIQELFEQPDAPRADVILLRVGATDLPGLAPVARAKLAAPSVPVVVLADEGDESTALRALQGGARGFALLSEATTRGLVTAIATALENHRMILQLDSARER